MRGQQDTAAFDPSRETRSVLGDSVLGHRFSELVTYYDLDLRPVFRSGAVSMQGESLDPAEQARRLPEAARAREQVRSTGEVQHRLLRLEDGRRLRLRAQPLVDGDNHPAGVSEFIHDVSDFCSAFGTISSPAAVRHRLLDGFGDAVFILDDKGGILDVNESAQRMYQLPREALIGLHPRDLADPERFNEAIFTDLLDRVAVSGRGTVEFWGLREDGSSFPQEVSMGRGVRYGEPVTVAAVRDISHRKQAERALMESEERFRTLLQNVPTLAVYGYRADGTVRYWNRASETLYGYSAEEAMGHSFLDMIVPPVGRMEAETAFGNILRTRKALPPHEAVFMRKNGSRVSVFSTCLLVQLPNRDPEIYHLDVDLTERKRAEEALIYAKELAESSNKAKGTFLATMSHEIRTPLHAVIGMSSQLVLSDLPEAQREMAQTIATSGEALLSLITDILDYSKIEAGKLEILQAPFPLAAAITDPLEIIAPQAAAKGVELSYIVDPQAPAVLIGDNPRLRQILLNLLSNAVKFTDHGEISLAVEAVHQEGDEWCIHFSVSDTGIGVPEAFQSRLFEPFLQAHAYATRQYGGSGLGLAISQKLVEDMGGIITVFSREGEGATFNFFIRAQADPTAGRIYTAEAPGGLAGKRIVIIDGNPNNRLMLTAAAQAWDMQAHTFANAGEVAANLRILRAADVVICNQRLSTSSDGLTAGKLHDMAQRKDLPVLLLGNAPATPKFLEEEGYAGALVVPIRPQNLHAMLVKLGTTGSCLETPPADISPSPETGRSLKVLIVEDNKVNQKVTRIIVTKLGHESAIAENGQEALEAMERTRYDVVLLDRQMPVMDGIATAEEILKRHPDPVARPKLIALTADAMEEDRRLFLAAGVDHYLSKPLRPADLCRAIDYVMGK